VIHAGSNRQFRLLGGIVLAALILIVSAADAVLFFLSPWARAVTGQNLIVDCGLVKG